MTTQKQTKAAAQATAKLVAKPLTHANLATIDGWEKLEPNEQTLVRDEALALDTALELEGKAKLSVGEHLYNIREVLEPKRMFTKFLTSLHRGFSRATAYRYIDMYTAAKTLLPEPIIKAAMLRGANRINVKAIEASPPPDTTNVVKINEYLDSIEHPFRAHTPESNPEVLKKECVNFVTSRFERLPRAGRTRPAWMVSFLGMCLAGAGYTTPITVEPVAIPEYYRGTRGRPKAAAAG